MTFDGGALPSSTDAEELQVDLLDETTGAVVQLLGPRWTQDSQNFNQYDLVAGSATFTQTIEPGLYSELYARGWSSSPGLVAFATPATEALPYGYHLLAQHVQVAAGPALLAIDIPFTDLQVSVTFGGGSIPTATDAEELQLALIDESTNAVVQLRGPQWIQDTQNFDQYDFVSGSDHFTQRIPPGTYSMLYERGWSSSPDLVVFATPASESLPYGYHLLQQHVVLGRGPRPLAIDIPSAQLQVAVTFNGAALPGTTDAEEMQVDLIDESTGALVQLLGPRWIQDSQNFDQYDLEAGSTTFAQTIVPGTYSVVYARGWSSSPNLVVFATPATEALPYGYHLLQQHVSLGAGAPTLAIDIPLTQLQVGVTFNGGGLPSTTDAEEMQVDLIDESTGALVQLLGPRWIQDTQNFDQYDLQPGSTRFTQSIVPGIYSVLYARGWSSSPNLVVFATPASEPLPYGYHLLQQHVAVAAGAQGLAVDVPSTVVGVNVTLNGAPLPSTTDAEEMQVELVDESTQATVQLLGPRWIQDSQNFDQYDLQAGSVPFFQTLIAGPYSVRYARGWTTSPDVVFATPTTETLPYGYSILAQHLEVPVGGAWMPIDIPSTQVGFQVTFQGGNLPPTTDAEELSLLLTDESTGFRVQLLGPRWLQDAQNFDQYDLVGGSSAFTQQLVDGNYGALYTRGWTTTSGPVVFATPTTESLPYGYHQLAACQRVGP